MAQQDNFVFAFRHVLSMERLVQEVRGLQTPDMYNCLKHYAINKHTQWEAYVNPMEELSVLDRIEWCEVFLKDLLLLHKHTTVFEQQMVERGADLERQLGSQEHEDKKLRLLLYKGETAVFIEDVCEDVLLRSARRLRTLVNWAYTVRTRRRTLHQFSRGWAFPSRSCHAGMLAPAHRADRETGEGLLRRARNPAAVTCRKSAVGSRYHHGNRYHHTRRYQQEDMGADAVRRWRACRHSASAQGLFQAAVLKPFLLDDASL